MKNFVQEGRSLNFVAPAGGVTAGVAELRGTILHVPATTAVEGQAYAGWIEGVYDLPCATGTAWEATAVPLYWDAANKRVTTTANGNTKIGVPAEAKLAATPSGPVRLIPTI